MVLQLMGEANPREQLMRAVLAGAGGTPQAAGSTPSVTGTDPATAAPAGTPEAGVPPTPPTGPGQIGEIRVGGDGRNYQYAQTSGMAGDVSGQGWIVTDQPVTPDVYKSPDDLITLYSQLANYNQKSDQIARSVSGILGAFSPNDEAIGAALGVPSGSGSTSSSGSGIMAGGLDDILKLQQSLLTAKQTAANRAALPDIAKQYGLDLKTATYLFDTGKLDTVIQEASKPDRQIITDAKDGRSYIVDLKTGQLSEPLGQPKSRETEIVTDENTGEKFAVYKDTKERVGTDSIVKGNRKTEYVDQPDGSKKLVYSDDKTPVGDPKRDIAAPPRKVTFIDDGKGGKAAVYEDGTRIPEKDIAGLGATEKSQLYHEDMVDRVRRGNPEISMEQWIKEYAAAGATKVTVDTGGNELGKPPEGMAWAFDDNGKVKRDDRGIPIALPISGSKIDTEAKDAAKVEANKSANEKKSANVVVDSIDDAIKIIKENKDDWWPTTGITGKISENIPGTWSYQQAELLKTVASHVGFDKLQEMRAASPTGAALGQVSDFENKLMQAQLGSLDTGQRPEYLLKNLRRIRALSDAIINHGIKDQAEADAIIRAADEADDTEPSIDDLVKKYKD